MATRAKKKKKPRRKSASRAAAQKPKPKPKPKQEPKVQAKPRSPRKARKRTKKAGPARGAPKFPGPAVPQLDGTMSTSRPGAAAAGTTLFVPFANKLRAYTFSTEKSTDFPSWHQDMAAPIVGVAAVRDDAIAVDAQGNTIIVAAHGQVLHALRVDDAPRSVCGSSSGRAAVLGARAVHMIEDGTAFEIGFAAPVAATFLDDDSLFVVGEGRRAARIGRGVMREVSAPPETIHAVCSIGARVHALGATGRWRFDNATTGWQRVPSDDVGAHIVASPQGTRLAFAPSARAIEVIDVATGASVRSCTWPAQMSRPEPLPIVIAGLAFRGEDRLLVALGAGQANLLHLDTGSAEKLDPFSGEPSYSWVFIYGGNILVAG